MKLTHHQLTIDIPLEGLIHIESVHINQGLNRHGKAEIKFMAEEEKAVTLVEQAEADLTVTVSRNDGKKPVIFCGRTSHIRAANEGGLYYLYLALDGHARQWDLTEKSQSFLKGNDTYEQVLNKVLAEYPKKEIRDEASEGAKIPGMLMQYEETDWEFLKRLASHFSTYLIADDTQPYGRVYFGIPQMDYGTVLTEEEYTVCQGKEDYDRIMMSRGLWRFMPCASVLWAAAVPMLLAPEATVPVVLPVQMEVHQVDPAVLLAVRPRPPVSA